MSLKKLNSVVKYNLINPQYILIFFKYNPNIFNFDCIIFCLFKTIVLNLKNTFNVNHKKLKKVSAKYLN